MAPARSACAPASPACARLPDAVLGFKAAILPVVAVFSCLVVAAIGEDTTTTTTTTSINQDIPFAILSAGADYTFGITTVQTLLEWGFPMSEREKTYAPEGNLWINIFSGYSHSCGTNIFGLTMCWGRNAERQCDIPDGYTFKALDLGEGHTCGLTNLQRLLCWGADTFNRLDVPTDVKQWTAFSVGSWHTCALTGGGVIRCWGLDGYGRLSPPYENEPDIFWEGVSCGDRHCCGMLTQLSVRAKLFREEDNVVCWGNNWLNQLLVPGPTQGRTGPNERFVDIKAGQDHTCGLTLSKRVWCWGYTQPYGLVSGIPEKNFTQITSGARHTCGIATDKLAYCWGFNEELQAEVPIDDRTVPPSILEYSNDPHDIYKYIDPWNRVTRYDPTDPQFPALHTYQYIIWTLNLKEFAAPGSLSLTFTIDKAGPPDPYSPHTLRFVTPEFDYPGNHLLQVSAFDLRYFHDQRWGLNPKVRSVTSNIVGGKTEHRLVDGGFYRVDLVYGDALGHRPQNHTLERLIVQYDLVTLAPIIYLPRPGWTKQSMVLRYELLEDMAPGTVWVTMLFDGMAGADAPVGVEDENSPHELQIAVEGTKKGVYEFEINLADTQNLFYGETNPMIQRTFQNGIVGLFRGLVTGGRYSMQFRCSDMFNNAEQQYLVEGLDYFKDIVTETMTVLRPTTIIPNPLIFEYILPERAYYTSLRIELIWVANWPDEPRGVPDAYSPHVWTVKPYAEDWGVRVQMAYGTANLFKDLIDEVQPQKDVRSFVSLHTPVRSYLQPFSDYIVRISYQDRFLNPRAFSEFRCRTNFTAPAPPETPTLLARSTTTLQIGWLRNETGGVRISSYELQFRELPKNVTVPLPEWATVLYNENRTVLDQDSRNTVFMRLKSSTLFRVRVRACNLLGCSAWTAWAAFRTLSACGDAVVMDGEPCDDGNLDNGDGCTKLCEVELGWKCSNLLLEDPSICVAAGIDGYRVGNEECDDCNDRQGDGCSPEGKVEPFWQCTYRGKLGEATNCVGNTIIETSYTADRCTVICGDGFKHYTEACDDGNLVDGDGCSSICKIEFGYKCEGRRPDLLRSECHPWCGDGFAFGAEKCDDGNDAQGDGCFNCLVEPGWVCRRENVTNATGTTVNVEVCRRTCLNGVIDYAEECDDANLKDGDGCDNCRLEPGWQCFNISARPTSISPGSFCVPLCGDGQRITYGPHAEQCDDGNNIPLDGCSPDCTTEGGWTCSPRVVGGVAFEDECVPILGDGIGVGDEVCDDGNKINFDGCNSKSQVEAGYTCTPATLGKPSRCSYLCGDGLVSPPDEACDDGNVVPNDGCNQACQTEPGWKCIALPGSSRSVCKPVCGDGVIMRPEECDDGGVSSGDGCDTVCRIEIGWICVPGRKCEWVCGDGIRMEGEECDDGNLIAGDGCDSTCKVERKWECASFVNSVNDSISVCQGICGDGYPVGKEECDDGNFEPNDGCDPTCHVEPGWVCCETPRGEASNCEFEEDRPIICPDPTCGNAFRDPGEDCDDGNRVAGDGCDYHCLVEPGFYCQIYLPGLPDFCEPTCRDGVQVRGEKCDDGNDIDGDGCDRSCRVEKGFRCGRAGRGSLCATVCGDGVRTLDEECDDGNNRNKDGCSPDCKVEVGFRCSGGSLGTLDECLPICGDGVHMERFEKCDTFSVIDVGCNAFTCALNPGYTCARRAGEFYESCSPVCGDGMLSRPWEQCDDHNLAKGDGCGETCLVEAAWNCSGSTCEIRCGDGRRHPSEECDDGNNFGGDGCSPDCKPELGFECLGGTWSKASECVPFCGDGLEVLGEECDDGNRVSRDGCSSRCQVEVMYFCSRGARPLSNGTLSHTGVSVCQRTCGNGFADENEECDEFVRPDPLGIMNPFPVVPLEETEYPRYCENCRLAPGLVCGDGRRANNTEVREECDDGNLVNGDGCDDHCRLERGWACAATPAYVLPPPGDVCAPVCGDGLVVPGLEACDDANLKGNDGCSPLCVVELFWHCFHKTTAELGANASKCVTTVPPKLIGADFDDTYARVDLVFSTAVVPFNLTTPAGPKFLCDALFLDLTMAILGRGPWCEWTAPTNATVYLGFNPELIPGSPMQVRSGVLRSHSFASITSAAPAHYLLATAASNATLRPNAVVVGPQVMCTCVDFVFLEAAYSRGSGGRAFTILWEVVEVVNATTHRQNLTETARARAIVLTQFADTKLVFVRFGNAYNEVDLDVDRSLRAGFVYRIRLTIKNLLGLNDTIVHNLKVVEEPIPMVWPLVDRLFFQARAESWQAFTVDVGVPQECQAAATDVTTTWLHMPTSPYAPVVDLAPYLGTPPVQAAILVGILGEGVHFIKVTSCAKVNLEFWNATAGNFAIVRRETCGYVTFKIDVLGTLLRPFRKLGAAGSGGGLEDLSEAAALWAGGGRRTSALPVGLTNPADLADAIAGATVRLAVFAQDGHYIAGQPEAEEPVAELLNAIQQPGNNDVGLAIDRGWPDVLDANRTMVLGAIVVPASNATVAQRKALAWVRPRVRWELSATRLSGKIATSPPLGQLTLGGTFMSLPPGQIVFGSSVSVKAEVELHPLGLGLPSSCDTGLKQLNAEATFLVNQPPTAGLLLVSVVATAPLVQCDLLQQQWTDTDFPLQYRFTVEDGETGKISLLSDWSSGPRLKVFFLPRRNETKILRGYVRDVIGSEASTPPVSLGLRASGASSAQELLELSEYRPGFANIDVYRSDLLTYLLSKAFAIAAAFGGSAHLQFLQDVVVTALTPADTGEPPSNCSTDCGLYGSCPKPKLYREEVHSTRTIEVNVSGCNATDPTGAGNSSNASAGVPESCAETRTVNTTVTETSTRIVAVHDWRSCVCAPPYTGRRCDRHPVEEDTQTALTGLAMEAFLAVMEGTASGVPFNAAAGVDTLARVLGILLGLVDNCRRVSTDVLEAAALQTTALLSQVRKAALRNAFDVAVRLLSRLTLCLPSDGDSAKASAAMPAPAVVLGELGTSSICITLNDTETKVCYDLATPIVQVSCPWGAASNSPFNTPIFSSSAVNATGGDVNHTGQVQTCEANLDLGLAEPYPCPCPVPKGDIQLGYGRPSGLDSLANILGARSEQSILWRAIAETIGGTIALNKQLVDPESAAAVAQVALGTSVLEWLHGVHAALNNSIPVSVEEAELRRQRRSIVQALRVSTEILGDAVTLAMVPGEAANVEGTEAMSMTASVSLALAQNASDAATVNRVSVALDTYAEVELQYPAEMLLDGSSVSTGASSDASAGETPAMFVPLAGVLWRGTGGPFAWLDPTRELLSSVVQLRLPGASASPSTLPTRSFSLLRYQFLVPMPSTFGSCGVVQGSSPQLFAQCCGAAAALAGALDQQACPPATLPPPTPPPPTTTTRMTTPAPTPPPAFIAGVLVRLSGSQIPFDGPLAALLENATFWIPPGSNVSVAGQSLHMKAGDLRIDHLCAGNNSSINLLDGAITLAPMSGGDFCDAVLEEAPTFSKPWLPTWGVGQQLLKAFDIVTAVAPYGSAVSTVGTPEASTWCGGTPSMLTDAWCPSGYGPQGDPLLAEVEVSDPSGVALVGISGAQISFAGSGELTIGVPSGTWITAFIGSEGLDPLRLMQSMYWETFRPVQPLWDVGNKADLLRTWRLPLTSTSTTTTTTTSRTTTTVSTTTRSTTTTRDLMEGLGPLVAPEPASGILLGLLEDSLDNYIALLAEAVNESGCCGFSAHPPGTPAEEYYAAYMRQLGLLRPFNERADEVSGLLDMFAVDEAPALDLESVLAGLLSAAALVDIEAARPLDEVLQALDAGVPAEWSAEYWNITGPAVPGDANSSTPNGSMEGGGSNDTTSSAAPHAGDNGSSQVPLITSCDEVPCAELPGCASNFDPAEEFECVAWSASVMRWVPALGCRVVPAADAAPQVYAGYAQVVCECERGVLHNAVAIVKRRATIVPSWGRLRIVTREILVNWTTKLNRYNIRGLYFFACFFVMAALHIIVAAKREVDWRTKARWVIARSERDRQVDREAVRVDKQNRDHKKELIQQIRNLQPRPFDEDLIDETGEDLPTLAVQPPPQRLALMLGDGGASQLLALGPGDAGPLLALAGPGGAGSPLAALPAGPSRAGTLAGTGQPALAMSASPTRAGTGQLALATSPSRAGTGQLALATTSPPRGGTGQLSLATTSPPRAGADQLALATTSPTRARTVQFAQPPGPPPSRGGLGGGTVINFGLGALLGTGDMAAHNGMDTRPITPPMASPRSEEEAVTSSCPRSRRFHKVLDSTEGTDERLRGPPAPCSDCHESCGRWGCVGCERPFCHKCFVKHRQTAPYVRWLHEDVGQRLYDKVGKLTRYFATSNEMSLEDAQQDLTDRPFASCSETSLEVAMKQLSKVSRRPRPIRLRLYAEGKLAQEKVFENPTVACAALKEYQERWASLTGRPETAPQVRWLYDDETRPIRLKLYAEGNLIREEAFENPTAACAWLKEYQERDRWANMTEREREAERGIAASDGLETARVVVAATRPRTGSQAPSQVGPAPLRQGAAGGERPEDAPTIFEMRTLEETAHETGREFDLLRQMNQSMGAWRPRRPSAEAAALGLAGTPMSPSRAAIVAAAAAASLPPPPPPPRPAALMDAGASHTRRVEEEAPDPMITEQKRKEEPLSLSELLALACERARPRNVWRACLIHHKLFFLPSDTQAFVFSAPERVAVFHMCLWFNAAVLVVLLLRETHFRPGEDPHCSQLGVMTAACFFYGPAWGQTFFSAFLTTVFSNLYLILCRGRSFFARTRGFSEDGRERAFQRHFLEKWPMCLHKPGEVTHWLVRCNPFRRRSDGNDENELHWQPSLVLLSYIILAPLIALMMLYGQFYFTSSSIMEQTTYSNRDHFVEIRPPPLEREEVSAAELDGMLSGNRVVVPLVQRYIVLLIFAWAFHLFLMEPAVFAMHLFFGEPTIDAVVTQLTRLRASCWRRLTCQRSRERCGRSLRKVAQAPFVRNFRRVAQAPFTGSWKARRGRRVSNEEDAGALLAQSSARDPARDAAGVGGFLDGQPAAKGPARKVVTAD